MAADGARRRAPRPGRPKKGDAKEAVLQVRFSDAELEQLREAASSEFLELATWARRLLLMAVRSADGASDFDLPFARQMALTPDQQDRVRRVAEADHMDAVTWMRRAVLRSVEAVETDQA